MIAEIYPVRRMPRGMDFFDYKTDQPVHEGDIVEINFKGRDLFGVVRKTTTKVETQKLKPISRIIRKKFFSPKDIKRVEQIAEKIAQSPTSIFNSILTGFQEFPTNTTHPQIQTKAKSIQKNDAELLKKLFEKRKPNLAYSIELSAEGEMALVDIIIKHEKEQILIIAPRENVLTQISHLYKNIAIISGKTPQKKRGHILDTWQNGSLKVLAGLKQVSIIPAQKIGTIIVLDTGASEYRKLDRNPKIDPRPAAESLAKQHNANLFYCTRVTRIEEYIKPEIECLYQKNETVEIISLSSPDQKTNIPFVSTELRSAIESEKGNILCIYNKKGTVKKLQCRRCSHIPTCGSCGSIPEVRTDDLKCHTCQAEMWIPTECPSCHAKTLTERGIGNARLLEHLKKAFPQKSIALIDQKTTQVPKADILLVTEFYLKNFVHAFELKKYTLVADMLFDLALTGTDFRTSEEAAYKLHSSAYFAKHHRARYLVQTFMPTEVQAMLNTKKHVKTQAEQRKSYELPPFKDHYTILDKSTKKEYKTQLITQITQNKNTSITPDIHSYE